LRIFLPKSTFSLCDRIWSNFVAKIGYFVVDFLRDWFVEEPKNVHSVFSRAKLCLFFAISAKTGLLHNKISAAKSGFSGRRFVETLCRLWYN